MSVSVVPSSEVTSLDFSSLEIQGNTRTLSDIQGNNQEFNEKVDEEEWDSDKEEEEETDAEEGDYSTDLSDSEPEVHIESLIDSNKTHVNNAPVVCFGCY